MFLHNFCLPGIPSAIIPLLHIISLVVSVTVTVGDDNEPNNVEFVLIYIFIVNSLKHFSDIYDKVYFSLLFVSYISMICIDIYLYMLAFYNCSF